jgi:hypothetical protein
MMPLYPDGLAGRPESTPRSFSVNLSTLLLFLCLPTLAMVDVAFGAMATLLGSAPFSPGVLLRGAIVFAIIAVTMRKFTRLGAVVSTLIFISVLSTLPALTVSVLSSSSVIGDVIHVTKAIFMPLMVGYFAHLIKYYRVTEDDVLRNIEYWSYAMTLGFVLPTALGIGALTYGDYAEGTKGFFMAGNDASLALGLGLFVVSYRLFFVKFSILRLMMFLLGMYAVISVGSRTGLVLAAACGVMLFLAVSFFRGRSRRVSLAARLSRNLAAVAFLVGVAYLVSLGLAMHGNSSYQQGKLQQLMDGEHPRATLVLVASLYLESRESWKALTGEGNYLFEIGVGEYWGHQPRKIAEVDWLDAFGMYGTIYAVTIHLLILLIIGVAVKNMLYSRSALSFILAGASGAYLFHSMFAGHALFTPTVSTIFAVCGALILSERQFRRDLTMKNQCIL